MAQNPNEQQQGSQQPQAASHAYTGGMKKDFNETFSGEGTWSHARNAINVSNDGQRGPLGNEPANLKLVDLPYPLIGALHIYKDQWLLFMTDDTNCEIAKFTEGTADYERIVHDPKLGLKRTNLITGAVKQNFDCTWNAYWEDGLNPSRTLNIDKPPYKQASVSKGACKVTTFSKDLDVEALRLAPLLSVPVISLRKGSTGGSLLNGSYQAVVAYTVNQVRVTDYFIPSNVQGLFTHENEMCSLELDITSMDTQFDEFELVIISVVNNQTSARRMGVYSTRQTTVYVDHIAETLPAVPIDLIPLQTPAYDRADSMYEVNNYLIRTGITSKFDFNYQPQAAKITSKWVAVKYPWDYYIKGGNMVGHMRDELYAYFIRWIYNTGQRSASYHIPGRELIPDERSTYTGLDAIELAQGAISQKWQVVNTATITSMQQSTLADGGTVIMEGEMGGWESTELYPDDKPNIWGSLCGQPIRHHKFPDNNLVNHHDQGGNNIIVLGIKFENITQPLDNEGKPITSIVGYEILRGSRDGNKAIVAKGLINNMAEYDIPNGVSSKQGLYPNYPYNDLRLDPFLSKTRISGGCGASGYTPMGSFRQDMFTFHSPETSFKNPFLSEYELKVHGELSGNVVGNFDIAYQHPRHKMLRDFSLLVAGIIGIGEALHKIKGKKTTNRVGPHSYNNTWFIGGVADGGSFQEAAGSAVEGYYTISGISKLIGDATGLDALASIIGITSYTSMAADIAGNAITSLVPGVITGHTDVTQESTAISELPLPVRVLEGLPTFLSLFSQSTDVMLDVIRKFSSFEQYGYQYNSHGLYDTYTPAQLNNTRRTIIKANYLDQHIQDFGEDFRINNLFRAKSVVLQLAANLANPTTTDNTRQTIGDQGLYKNPTSSFITQTSAYYASMKVAMPAQYGQLENIIQVPIPGSYAAAPGGKSKASTGVLFGGDTYINRFTEKNTFFYFNDWMRGQPDGFEYDYRMRYNIPYAKYWVDTQYYDTAQLTNALVSFNFKGDVLPNDMAHLDRDQGDCNTKISFIIRQAYFYLFSNGVRDFFCESEINLGYRDHGDSEHEQIFDPKGNTDLKTLFRSDIIKSGNYCKYDYSLSVSKLYQNHASWGTILPRYYDPLVAEKCYSYYPKRAIYSLQQQTEFLKDNWRVFLVNNYKDFPGRITAIKAISQSGALILMENEAPLMFQGIDQLQTNAGVKLTIGDGGLFSSPMQSVSNGDVSFEYGSTQSKYSVSATPNGLYYMCVDQGRIHEYGGVRTSYYSQPLQDVSALGNKFWFERYLPYQLLKDFPDFELLDNPVIGIGCQSVFDNTYEIMYFTKKDYQLKPQYKGLLIYIKDNIFAINGNTIELGDPLYFNDASWTISFDQQQKQWLSFHDWHPDFVLPGKNHFMTVKGNAIWKHNVRCDLFCNFYGKDYPFEIEHIAATGQAVNIIKSLEYLLECYKYADNCNDRFHEYSFNFDRAIIYNSEQNSGLLRLNFVPQNNPAIRLKYPKVNSNAIDILYSKEEQKYRFNQFWDATKDRGLVSGNEIQMWNTGPNGYDRTLNDSYIDYNKAPIQRKKLRHQYHRILFKRMVSGNIKMLLKLANIKLNTSEH